MAITKISPDVVDFDSALVVSPTLTIGDATAEDTKIVFDGNAQDFYIGLDDSADDLVIGLGSTVGTTPAIVIDENLKIGVGTTPATGVRLDMRSDATTNIADFRNANSGGFGLYTAGGSSSSQYALRAADKDNTALFTVLGDGNVAIADGNVTFASGHGIDFSATGDGSGTDSSELLDDYEEGTFTPAFGDSVTTATANGRYTKIGRLVNFSIEIGTSVSNITGGVTAGITGLPYAVPTNQSAGSCFSQYVDNGPFTTVYVYSTGPTLYLYEQSSSSYHPMQYADMNDASAFFYIQGTYITS